MIKNKVRLQEGDVCMLFVEGKPQAYIHITEINDHEDPQGRPGWNEVKFNLLISNPPVPGQILIDDDHLNQDVFTIDGIPHQIKLASRAVKKGKDKVAEIDNISLF